MKPYILLLALAGCQPPPEEPLVNECVNCYSSTIDNFSFGGFVSNNIIHFTLLSANRSVSIVWDGETAPVIQ